LKSALREPRGAVADEGKYRRPWEPIWAIRSPTTVPTAARSSNWSGTAISPTRLSRRTPSRAGSTPRRTRSSRTGPPTASRSSAARDRRPRARTLRTPRAAGNGSTSRSWSSRTAARSIPDAPKRTGNGWNSRRVADRSRRAGPRSLTVLPGRRAGST